MRQVEGSSDSTAENFSLKVKKLFTRSPKRFHSMYKKIEKINDSAEKNSPKWSSGHVECSFDDLSNIF